LHARPGATFTSTPAVSTPALLAFPLPFSALSFFAIVIVLDDCHLPYKSSRRWPNFRALRVPVFKGATPSSFTKPAITECFDTPWEGNDEKYSTRNYVREI
jgi:hypothetical protein